MLTWLVWILVAVIFSWHIYGAAVTSWHIARSEFFEPWQKTAQYLIAWLLPIVGVALILHMLGPDVRKRRPGWVPLLEPLVLASFGISAANAMESIAPVDAGSEPPVDSAHGDGGSD